MKQMKCSVGCACGNIGTECKDCEICIEFRTWAKEARNEDYSSYLYR